MEKKLVSVLIPCFNEQEALPCLYEVLVKTINELEAYAFELLFVNDGSVDHTLELIRHFHDIDGRVSYIDLSRNFGKENAMLAGFDYVKGDCVIVMDADLQDSPSLIPEMLHWWEEGYEDVYAKRRDRGRESWLRKHLTLTYYHILDKSTRFEVLKNVGDFRLLDRKCIEAMKQLRENERYTKGMYAWIGYRKKEILFDRADRVAGESNWSYWSLLNLAIDGITSFTTAPLRLATIIGFIIAMGAFTFLLYYLSKRLLFGDPVQGFTTLVCIILFLGGGQLISIGILGEYIGKIFNETKQRPTYLIRDYIVGKDVADKDESSVTCPGN